MIDVGSVKHRVTEFHKLHSVDGPSVQAGEFIRYPNGAYRDTNVSGQ